MKHWSCIALQHQPDQAWANGAGFTRELLTWPAPTDWNLRLSVATITTRGPYSQFPQTQRWHLVLKGQLALTLPHQTQVLDAQSAPFPFDGNLPCTCDLIEGPASAFNVMVKGAYTAHVQRLDTHSGTLELSQCLNRKLNWVLAGFYTETVTQMAGQDDTQTLAEHQWFWHTGTDIAQSLSHLTLQSGKIICVLLGRTPT